MSLSLINKVKYSPWLYTTWFYVGSLAVNILKLFVRTDKKLIVFVSFGGKRFNDSPRCIYDKMIEDHRFDGYDLVWAFINPEKFSVPRGRKIKIDTLTYYITLLKAVCWVTNSTVERGLQFKGKNVFYLNTWHGVPIKKMGSDIDAANTSFSSKNKNKYAPYDLFAVNGKYDADIFERSFRLKPESVGIIGYPRNDELVSGNTVQKKEALKQKLGIDKDKKVILYAPTFREFSKDEGNNCTLIPPIDWVKWKEQIGNDYIVLFRAHYEVVKVMNIEESDFLKNVSDYSSLNELMLVSDILVSDYSSVYFDYSILGKPMLTFCYDYDEYVSKRGLYFDVRAELGDDNQTEDDLLKTIKNLDVELYRRKAIEFRNKYMECYGKSSYTCLDKIIDSISK